MIKFRDLTADEIDCRVSTINEKGLTLLLYKDARCDMNILDETVGSENWERDHKELKGNIYCGIGIWNEAKNRYVWKWDCGSESYTEKEKGEASDSFKRAGFNWGIGRELYTAPFIWVSAGLYKAKERNGKITTNDRFKVSQITIKNKKITDLTIVNQTSGEIVYRLGFKIDNKKRDINQGEKQAEQVKKQNNEQMTLEQAHNFQLTSGKYNGVTLGELMTKDKSYVDWLAESWHGQAQQAAKMLLDDELRQIAGVKK